VVAICKHSPYLVIWDPEGHLEYQDPSKNVLSENTEVRVEQPSASVYVLYLYKLH